MKSNKMTLKIRWQRLVIDGETCERCGFTEVEVESAMSRLKDSLGPLGVKIKLEKEELSEENFKEKPRSSNAIFINGKPLEEWIDADTGESKCCDVCGDEDCRTVIVGDEEYEVVPSELIVEGGFKAVSEKDTGRCCSTFKTTKGCCCD